MSQFGCCDFGSKVTDCYFWALQKVSNTWWSNPLREGFTLHSWCTPLRLDSYISPLSLLVSYTAVVATLIISLLLLLLWSSHCCCCYSDHLTAVVATLIITLLLLLLWSSHYCCCYSNSASEHLLAGVLLTLPAPARKQFCANQKSPLFCSCFAM